MSKVKDIGLLVQSEEDEEIYKVVKTFYNVEELASYLQKNYEKFSSRKFVIIGLDKESVESIGDSSKESSKE